MENPGQAHWASLLREVFLFSFLIPSENALAGTMLQLLYFLS